MASRRTKSIGTKVTPEEYDRIHALAGDLPVSEWVRAALLRAAETSPAEPLVLDSGPGPGLPDAPADVNDLAVGVNALDIQPCGLTDPHPRSGEDRKQH
jgi:hypothetical protein